MEQDDEVPTVIRRGSVPRRRAWRVRAATYRHWRRRTRYRSRLRSVWSLARLAAGAGLNAVLAGTATRAGDQGGMRVELSRGAAWAREAAANGSRASRPLHRGDRIQVGTALLTEDAGRVALGLPSGHSLRLDTDTRVRFVGTRSLILDRGGAYVDSGAAARAADGLVIYTHLGTIQETGTQYELRVAEGDLRLRVREGTVKLRSRGGARQVAGATEARLDLDGSRLDRRIATHGADWDWIAAVTPMLDLQGASVQVFLDWIVRERGWTLIFGDEVAACSAKTTVLGGGLDALTLDQALEAVATASRMICRLKDGVLVVRNVERTSRGG